MAIPVHAQPAAEALRALGSDERGLTSAQAARRLEEHGRNVLRVSRPASAWSILLDQLRSVVVALLVVASVVSLLSGDVVDAIAIGAVLAINTVLGFVTEIRARRAMEALLRLDAPHATVVRDGTAREIDASELVPGDVIALEAGQSVPADARIVTSSELRVDEAPLTGESVPVEKSADAAPVDAPLPERPGMLFKGTTVLAGAARAVVTGTGMETELGRIGGLVADIPDERTPLELRLDALGRRLVWVALGAGAAVAALGLLQGAALAKVIETAIALAIAAVPEGLPAVATIALAVGVRRMARRQALVRRLPSVETLGSVTVICTDKTGTLTAGQMTVTTLAVGEREISVSGAGYEPVGRFTEDERELAVDEDRSAARSAARRRACQPRAAAPVRGRRTVERRGRSHGGRTAGRGTQGGAVARTAAGRGPAGG